MSKVCLECGATFNGRADKKFCSNLCRNTYNNRARAGTSNYFRAVNSSLNKNYKILKELSEKEATKTPKSMLMDLGFNFGFYTNVYDTPKGTSYYCYEYGYLPAEDDCLFLVKKRGHS